MVDVKSLDNSEVIAALIRDVQNAHGLVFNTKDLNNTLKKVSSRLRSEGIGFLTKTLPRLGKHFDKCLQGITCMNAAEYGFKPIPGSKLPRFLGELFKQVFQLDGALLQAPCANCIKSIRQVLFLYYKYKLPYTDEQEQQVLQRFERTEEELADTCNVLSSLGHYHECTPVRHRSRKKDLCQTEVTRGAQNLLIRLFAHFDPLDINPRHGPGVVSTKETLWEKYLWTNVSGRITDMYPFDAYFCASAGAVCDRYNTFNGITEKSNSAKVILVPKDSRGPRLISCEPVDYQWIQQGLGRAIVKLVESHPITKWNVNFTHQYPNRCGALLGSRTGGYATLDLNEASDRVSTELVRLLFPPRIFEYLDACRSSSTVLPDGRVLNLRKFAPMGSSLCFPILALTIWAILSAAAPNAYTRERILVYGDDVIVPTAFAANAIEHLESFGLKVNRDKSCTSGFFRESCGMDAFKGVDVTPVRLRTVWSSVPSPDSYTSWVAYANSFFARKCYHLAYLIGERLVACYGPIPSKEHNVNAPSLWLVPDTQKKLRSRSNARLQKREYYCLDVSSPSITKVLDGWSMLLRYFAESGVGQSKGELDGFHEDLDESLQIRPGLSVSSYTSRRSSVLKRCWR